MGAENGTVKLLARSTGEPGWRCFVALFVALDVERMVL
jgi:hypothetical protein